MYSYLYTPILIKLPVISCPCNLWNFLKEDFLKEKHHRFFFSGCGIDVADVCKGLTLYKVLSFSKVVFI